MLKKLSPCGEPVQHTTGGVERAHIVGLQKRTSHSADRKFRYSTTRATQGKSPAVTRLGDTRFGSFRSGTKLTFMGPFMGIYGPGGSSMVGSCRGCPCMRQCSAHRVRPTSDSRYTSRCPASVSATSRTSAPSAFSCLKV